MALNEGQKFEGYAQIDYISLEDVFVILDKSDTTMSPGGTTKYVTAQQMSLFFAAASNSAIQNSYLTITLMLADQENQTSGNIQFVADASSDSTVSNGYAYYEYLGGSNGLLSDYRKLSEEEVSVITSNHRTFVIKEISSSEPNDPGIGQIAFRTESSKVSHIRFDVNYSQFLLRNKADLDAGRPVALYIDNITRKNRTIYKVISFNTDESSYIVKVEGTEASSNFNLQDKIEVLVDYTKPSKIERFTATASQTEFVLTDAPSDVMVIVNRSGQIQDAAADYTLETNTSTTKKVVFANGLRVNSRVEILKIY